MRSFKVKRMELCKFELNESENMEIHTIVWIATCCAIVPLVHSVVQYKLRGPPIPPRPPHMPMYSKYKWPIQQRLPTRPYSRPMPVQMASYKVPVIARPLKTPAPLIFPSAVWKTPTAVYRPPVEKPFIISPPVTQIYDVPVKQEPAIIVPTIKQVGEKGPIHTIPAPNLSPADKPEVILEEPVQKHVYQYTKEPEISPNAISSNIYGNSALLGAQALPLVASVPTHQYQVTENTDHKDQLVDNQYNTQKIYYSPDSEPNNLIQKLTQYADANVNNVKLYPTDMYMAPQQLALTSAGQLSAQDLYQLLNTIPQQQLIDNYGMPLVHQPQLQQHFVQQTQPITATNYQTHTPQLLQAESAYFNQIPDAISQQIKDNFKPQFHTFNYVEPTPQNVPRKQFAQSRVTADYSLEPEASADTTIAALQNAQDALAQTQYIQHYFATREDGNAVNNENVIDDNLSKDGSNRASEILSELSAKNEISPSMFYSSLPNKEAADRLASLQAAGNINSNLRKIKQKQPDQNLNQREQMRIYVPDEEDSYEDMETQASGENAQIDKHGSSHGIRVYENTYAQDKSDTQSSEEHGDYEDYSTEEDPSNLQLETRDQGNPVQKSHQSQVTFGTKLQTQGSNTR
ncbi:hypothetical protein CBL_04595 [Carabus blaptoides fortunei]